MIKRQKSVDSAINFNASSPASLEGHPALVAPESFNSHKEVVAPIATMESSVSAELNEVSSTASLRSINNGSIQNSAIKRFNQLLIWLTTPALPYRQVGFCIQGSPPTLKSPAGPISKEVAPSVTIDLK